MQRGSRIGLAVIVVAVVALVGVVLHGSPKPAAYTSPGDPLAGRTLYQPASPPAALFVGDSYTEGTGASDPTQGFACQTAAALGMICNDEAQPGTGFVNDGHADNMSYQPYPARIAGDAQRYEAATVFITGGRNDTEYSTGRVRTAMISVVDQVRRAYPKARLVIVAPFWSDSHPPASLLALRDAERDEAATVGALFVDPLAANWLTDSNASEYIGPDHVHPNQAGHDYLAQQLITAVKAAAPRK